MNLSIIILTCNQCELTLRCLKSLNVFLSDQQTEIIVIDNGSFDNTEEKVKKYFPSVRFYKLNQNGGVAKGRNYGVSKAKGKRILFLDNDTIASENAIKGLYEFLDNHKDCGIVGPKLISPSGKIQESFKDYPGIGIKIKNWIFKKDAVVNYNPPLHEPFYVIGAAQMFDKELFDKLGGLDSKIFFGPEDADFCINIRRSGKKIIYNPEFSIIHDYQRSTSGRKLTKRTFMHIKALLYFYFKHHRFF